MGRRYHWRADPHLCNRDKGNLWKGDQGHMWKICRRRCPHSEGFNWCHNFDCCRNFCLYVHHCFLSEFHHHSMFAPAASEQFSRMSHQSPNRWWRTFKTFKTNPKDGAERLFTNDPLWWRTLKTFKTNPKDGAERFLANDPLAYYSTSHQPPNTWWRKFKTFKTNPKDGAETFERFFTNDPLAYYISFRITMYWFYSTEYTPPLNRLPKEVWCPHKVTCFLAACHRISRLLSVLSIPKIQKAFGFWYSFSYYSYNPLSLRSTFRETCPQHPVLTVAPAISSLSPSIFYWPCMNWRHSLFLHFQLY